MSKFRVFFCSEFAFLNEIKWQNKPLIYYINLKKTVKTVEHTNKP